MPLLLLFLCHHGPLPPRVPPLTAAFPHGLSLPLPAPGVGSFFGAAGDAAGAVGDRVMGENEQAEAMQLLRTTYPRWNQEVFLVRRRHCHCRRS